MTRLAWSTKRRMSKIKHGRKLQKMQNSWKIGSRKHDFYVFKHDQFLEIFSKIPHEAGKNSLCFM